MRRFAPARWLCAVLLAGVTGCAENSLVLQGQLDRVQKEQLALTRQREELQTRATALDRDNQELVAKLTQERQRTKVLEDQVAMIQGQLNSTNGQLAKIRDEKQSTDQKVQALMASVQRQGGAPIIPNNSLLETLPTINLPEVYVRRDGDVIRVELPAQRLFQPGNAMRLQGADQMIATVAAELLRDYPNHILGVEGHTDSDPIPNSQWRNHHQLSIGRALSVHDVLIDQVRLPASQLVVVGHGANHPILSNATPTGRQRNSRVELVVYPETVGGTP